MAGFRQVSQRAIIPKLEPISIVKETCLSRRHASTTVSKAGSSKTGTAVTDRKYDDGYVYKGGWKEDKREGQGKLTSVKGQVWEGEFRDGKVYKGSGALEYPDGTVLMAKWVKWKMEGQGKLTQTNGSYLEGEFKNDNIYSGVGVMVHPDGTVSRVTYEAGKQLGEPTLFENLSAMNKSVALDKTASEADGQNEEE